MSTSSARRRIVRSLLSENQVASQGEIVGLLAKRGFDVTQATVSRDLASIGAHKDGGHYVLGRGPDHKSSELALAGTIDAFVESIVATGNLVVIKTPPGAAQVVAAALDRAALPDMAGCVAGDDTVMIAITEGVTGRHFADKLQDLGASI